MIFSGNVTVLPTRLWIWSGGAVESAEFQADEFKELILPGLVEHGIPADVRRELVQVRGAVGAADIKFVNVLGHRVGNEFRLNDFF
jgi:hypothetical protein